MYKGMKTILKAYTGRNRKKNTSHTGLSIFLKLPAAHSSLQLPVFAYIPNAILYTDYSIIKILVCGFFQCSNYIHTTAASDLDMAIPSLHLILHTVYLFNFLLPHLQIDKPVQSTFTLMSILLSYTGAEFASLSLSSTDRK